MVKENCLLVKTASEIALKSFFVRARFTKKLVQSIKLALKRNSVQAEKILKGGGRIYLFTKQGQLKKAQKVLLNVFGIHAIAAAAYSKSTRDLERAAVEYAKEILGKGNSFAVRCRVLNNKELKKQGLERKLGAAIQKAVPGLDVDLGSPDKTVFVEVKGKDFFIYSAQKRGLGGLPPGCQGSVAMFFAGKRQELAAAFLIMKRGCNIFPVVKKKSARLEAHLAKLVRFNSYRKFVLTEEKDLKQLVADRKLKAVVTADSVLSEKTIKNYVAFDSQQDLLVLRPLLLYPEESCNGISALF